MIESESKKGLECLDLEIKIQYNLWEPWCFVTTRCMCLMEVEKKAMVEWRQRLWDPILLYWNRKSLMKSTQNCSPSDSVKLDMKVQTPSKCVERKFGSAADTANWDIMTKGYDNRGERDCVGTAWVHCKDEQGWRVAERILVIDGRTWGCVELCRCFKDAEPMQNLTDLATQSSDWVYPVISLVQRRAAPGSRVRWMTTAKEDGETTE